MSIFLYSRCLVCKVEGGVKNNMAGSSALVVFPVLCVSLNEKAAQASWEQWIHTLAMLQLLKREDDHGRAFALQQQKSSTHKKCGGLSAPYSPQSLQGWAFRIKNFKENFDKVFFTWIEMIPYQTNLRVNCPNLLLN